MDFLNDHSLIWLLGLVLALSGAGLAAGLLAGLLGVGGGIVVVPVLFHLFTLLGIDESVRMHVAVATSLATIIPTAMSSTRAHYKRGNVDAPLLATLTPGLVLGVVIGGIVSGRVTGATLTLIFAVIALLVAANMSLRKQPKIIADALPGRLARTGIGAVIGSLSTMMGIGGGTLSVPTLSAFNYPLLRAVGTAAAIGLIIAIPGVITFMIVGAGVPERPPGSIGYVNLVGFALIVPTTMLAAPWGARLASAIDPKLLRNLFALFLLITSLRMFYDFFG